MHDWNTLVDEYIFSGRDGHDYRPRFEIELDSKIGPNEGQLYRRCEAEGCPRVDGRGVTLRVLSSPAVGFQELTLVCLNILLQCKLSDSALEGTQKILQDPLTSRADVARAEKAVRCYVSK